MIYESVNNDKYYQFKLIKAGYYWTIKQYLSIKKRGEKKEKKEKKEIRYFDYINDNLLRAKHNLVDLIHSNIELNKFITLTFKENICELKKANKQFKNFVLRLRYNCGDIKYISVPELQKRGAIHYHLLSDLDYIPHKKLSRIWNNGFVWINRIEEINDIALYLSKYISKDLIANSYKCKKYFASENIKRPVIEYNDLALKTINDNYKDLTLLNEYHSNTCFYEYSVENYLYTPA